MLDFSSLQASVKVIYKNNSNIGVMEMPKPSRNLRPQPSPPLLCPRCNSTNTKFCYYNNYSKSQPRYLCKACRRHWTAGGILRDVPVGGGRKKNRTKLADTSQTTDNTGFPNYTSTLNNSSSLVQRLLNGNPSSTVFPEMLRRVILQTPPQTSFRGPEENGVRGSAQIHAMPDNFGFTSSLIGSRHNADTNLRSYLSGSNAPNFSLSGYPETGLNGFGMAPPLQLIGTENWDSWDDEISELVNMEGKPTE